MLFEYHTSPIRNTVIAVAIIVLVSFIFILSSLLLTIMGLSIAAGPALWALIQWRRRGHGVRFTDSVLTIEYPLLGRSRNIRYVDILGCASTADDGLIVAYLRREKQPEAGNYPAISRVALAQARPPVGIRRQLAISPHLKDIDGCLAALAQHQEHNPPSIAEHFAANTLRTMARRRSLRNTILLLLAVLATPLYVIIIARVLSIFH